MPRRSLGIVLAAFSCLLALTTSASAECAWVLWEYTNSGAAWKPVEAFTGERACKTERTARMVVPGMVSAGYSWNCFPDTVDPRGPKGK